jgi:adenosyl cobinamide kinase/adenosyl cobinamide phosphate guanylyltransferase
MDFGGETGKGAESMTLIIGGAASGKREYVKSLGYADAQMSDGALDSSPCLLNLHRLVRSDISGADALFAIVCDKEVITCDEVGGGVIPLDPVERDYREAVGRLCVRLAARADRVVRMVAGISMVIKG